MRAFSKQHTKAFPSPHTFVFTTARNLLIDKVRHDQVVPIEAAADLDLLEFGHDIPNPERHAIARDDLRRLQDALSQLPPRCRQAVILRKVEGLSLREISERMSAVLQMIAPGLLLRQAGSRERPTAAAEA